MVRVDHIKAYTAAAEMEGPSQAATLPKRAKPFEVLKVLDERRTPDGLEYELLWAPCFENDWANDEATWQKEEDCTCAERIQEYHIAKTAWVQ